MTGSSLGSVPERRARLARRHLLAAPARAETAAEVAAALIALHGTDPASVYLAAWARSADGHRAIGAEATSAAVSARAGGARRCRRASRARRSGTDPRDDPVITAPPWPRSLAHPRAGH